MENKILHNKEKNRFELIVNDLTCYAEYKIRGNEILFTHTKVPHELEGKGLGSTLVKYALDYAFQNNLTIVPLCSFVRIYIERHPEYQQNL